MQTATKSIMDMDRDQFILALSEKTTPKGIEDNAGKIYGYMSTLFNENALDSLLREWAFQWASEQLNQDYDIIYDKWLNGFCL